MAGLPEAKNEASELDLRVPAAGEQRPPGDGAKRDLAPRGATRIPLFLTRSTKSKRCEYF